MKHRIRDARGQQGFTLIELLIVIVILGILAGVVVFAVSGISDRGQGSACKAEKQSLVAAQQAYFAKEGSYAGSATALKTAGFIATDPSWHTTAGSGAVTASGPCTAFS
jgi:prepilin-type N-terminal cleavage/methylation domain-containing protein